MKVTRLLVLVLGCILMVSCAGMEERQEPKIPIVLVSSGVFPTNDFSAFETLEQKVKEAFPGHTIRWAFTDQIVIEQIRKDQVVYFTRRADGREPDDIIGMLKAEGYSKVLVQPLAMLPSELFRALEIDSYPGIRVLFGEPIIRTQADIAPTVAALESELPDDTITTVIVAPGDADDPAHEMLLVDFADAIESEHRNVFVLSAEGRPGERRLAEASASAEASGNVHLIPFVFMPRKEAIAQRIFENGEVWRRLVAKPRTTTGKALVYNRDISDMLLKRLAQGIERSKMN